MCSSHDLKCFEWCIKYEQNKTKTPLWCLIIQNKANSYGPACWHRGFSSLIFRFLLIIQFSLFFYCLQFDSLFISLSWSFTVCKAAACIHGLTSALVIYFLFYFVSHLCPYWFHLYLVTLVCPPPPCLPHVWVLQLCLSLQFLSICLVSQCVLWQLWIVLPFCLWISVSFRLHQSK